MFLVECLSFYAQDLFEGVNGIHQVRLVFHDLVDVLVGARDLVDNTFILAALDAGSLRNQVFPGELTLRNSSRHPTSGAVRAGAERLLVALRILTKIIFPIAVVHDLMVA